MTNYCMLADCADPAISVKQRHVDSGNVYVDVVLRERGINPSDVVLPKTLLTEIAAVYAKREAAIAGAIGDESILIDKARQFKATLDMLISGLSKAALGITETAGFGNVTLGRG